MTAQYQDSFPIARKLRHLTLDWTAQRVTDLGCNIGQLGDYVLDRGARSYVGYDHNASYITVGRRRYPHLDLRVGRADEADLNTDVLAALGLFHHMNDEAITRVVSDTTAHTIVYEVPYGPKALRNYRIRPRDWYDSLFTGAGFSEPVIYPYGFHYPIPRTIFVARREAAPC